jgi:hypothetical protein
MQTVLLSAFSAARKRVCICIRQYLELRATRFKDVNPFPSTAENANSKKDKIDAPKLKYGTKQLRYLDQRQMH